MMEGLAYKLVKATEAAAFSAHKLVGFGNEKNADQVAVDAMRSVLNSLEINGVVVIGEGERDKAPMLSVGEKVGIGKTSSPEIDIAVDPLEGTKNCAFHRSGSMSVLAATRRGNFLQAPDVYMEKIAVGNNLPEGVVSLKMNIEQNLSNLALAKERKMSDLVVAMLKRKRHSELIAKIRKLNVKIRLIDDGDIAAIISLMNNKFDMYTGIGGTPEGVLAAAALRSIGGQMEGRLIFDTDQLKERAKKFGVNDTEKIYTVKDMIRDDSLFIATGVTGSELVDGIELDRNTYSINSVIILPDKLIRIMTKGVTSASCKI